jgi:nicotinamidase-related amidase
MPHDLNPARTAVLAMDCQPGIVAAYSNDDGLLQRAAQVLQDARQAGMPVIHIRVGFRPGLPEVSARNPLFGAIKANPERLQLFSGAAGEIHSALGPEPTDIVITKHRVSAFTGTDLAMILRAFEIDTLILFGIATSGVVLSTLLEASDADFRLFVIADCCADRDQELHRVLLENLFPRRATVLNSAGFI